MIDATTLESICDLVESSEMLRFIVPHDRPLVAELVEKGDRERTEHADGLIALTCDDDRVSLLQARETLELLLLALAQHGVQYAVLNRPVEVPHLRRELQHLLRSPKPPQLLLRIG
jgi:hypothetical protein